MDHFSLRIRRRLEIKGFEPLALALQRQCSTNWAIFPRESNEMPSLRFFPQKKRNDGEDCWTIPDLNRWPHAYQACALTDWANSPKLKKRIFQKSLVNAKSTKTAIEVRITQKIVENNFVDLWKRILRISKKIWNSQNFLKDWKLNPKRN